MRPFLRDIGQNPAWFPKACMRHDINTFIKITSLIAALLTANMANAQWGAPFANSWIHYGKPYVRIGVAKKGLHKISFSDLPGSFPTDSPDKIQLWRRGRQVSIISISDKEILFYAVPNDGASDSLLYRPMNSRINPYFSMYSDEGSYFLTLGDSPGHRAKVIDEPIDSNVPLLPFHKENVATVFKNEYSLGTTNPIGKPSFLNSFFELGASRTGKMQDKDGAGSLTGKFKLQNLVNIAQKPTIKLLIHGRSDKEHKIEIYVGKNSKSLRLVTVLASSRFTPTEYTFELKPEDTDADNSGMISLKTVNADRLDRFSLTYYAVEFPQQFQIGNEPGKEFRLLPTKDNASRVSIKGASAGFTLLDISDPDNPILLKGKNESVMVPRRAGKEQILLATKEVVKVDAAKIKEAKFQTSIPKEPDYIIITTDSLLEGAKQFANYRASQVGGGFKPLVINILDIYNQFNYGEPSPVAIRKFLAYMLTDGSKDKYLFLIGKSITQNEAMKRELPGEVPTIGYPASDILLVEGLAGAPQDVPAIPVGRLSAVTNQHVIDYLQKVKDYESMKDYSWRKNVLHLNGGKTVGEISQLKGLLTALEPDVEKGELGGKVKQFVKQKAMQEPEPVNITAEVNAGVGLITFFGHGSWYITDLDMGYITDAARSYNNLHKYPMMYFNGCGVGNIFANKFNQKPKTANSTDRITLSLDWLLAPNRGAIAIIANSYESYVSPSAAYLQRLYHFMFTDSATAHLPIGKIQMAVANDIVSKHNDAHSIANVHQTLLQGDPALKLITINKPDYAVDPDESIALHGQSANKSIGTSDSLKVQIKMSNNGRFLAGQNVPVSVTYFGRKGNRIKTESVESFASQNVLQVTFHNSRDIQKIRVEIDPKRAINELNVNNNVAELDIDWDLIKDKNTFTSENAKDVVPPLLTVKFNDRLLASKEIVASKPEIAIYLSDDRQLIPDTSLIEIFIKRCGDDACDFEKITYSKNNIKINPTDLKALQLSYLSDLAPGVYEILINAKDRAGNAVVQPYRMLFEILDDDDMPTELIVSPNPAASYLRFELKTSEKTDLKSIRYIIYDQRGIVVEDKILSLTSGALTNEWYWMPSDQSAGLYTYKVLLINDRNEAFVTFPGKVIIHGK
ncbi:C25 family cysteine peptidase [Dyadobacter chenwenxiniae]|uniref:C25 family cysteine peptidase n=1 Tax=Dyadobacter chenwenxiniae TaxID=2906456 RepID=A0A9X1PPB4_9BACT|nr:C25 family cysteine peptidase [Dyadobacter chenwenxiniae]MCF0064441.1 C25 family cysteine peptidase [Dyadobacter chenwenxiniae]UON82354.1 C25 family cysteine peptidase [Dyadobacter chenwenxiniae]